MHLRMWISVLVLLFLIPTFGYAGEVDALYVKAFQAARGGRVDFAFMYYNELDRTYPYSRYRDKVLFVRGEYYYQLPSYFEAAKHFSTLTRDYPQLPCSLFATAYLYKIAQATQDTASLERLKKDILAFEENDIFSKELKEYKYLSPLFNLYRMVIADDVIEFYKGQELFVSVVR